jgi:hypothetical protein
MAVLPYRLVAESLFRHLSHVLPRMEYIAENRLGGNKK